MKTITTGKCPQCNITLVEGKKRRYETLSEHCVDPNKYFDTAPPLRRTFVCPNKCFGRYAYWSMFEGGGYLLTPWWMRILWKITDYKFPRRQYSIKDLDLES